MLYIEVQIYFDEAHDNFVLKLLIRHSHIIDIEFVDFSVMYRLQILHHMICFKKLLTKYYLLVLKTEVVVSYPIKKKNYSDIFLRKTGNLLCDHKILSCLEV